MISQWIFRFSPRFSGLNPYLNELVEGNIPESHGISESGLCLYELRHGGGSAPRQHQAWVGSCPGLCIDSKKRQLAGESSCPRYVTHSRPPPKKKLFFLYFSLESELRSLGCLLLFNVQSTLYFYNFLHGAALQSCVIVVQHGLSMVKVYSSHAHVFIL